MTSIRYNPHCAASTAIERGSILATDDDGTDAYEITGTPHVFTNVVGGLTFYEYDVRVLATRKRGTMTFAASDTVYLRTEYDTEGNQL